jgi:hypothetical protein
MTVVQIEPGPSGLPVVVRAEKLDRQNVKVSIESDCEHLTELAARIDRLSMRDVFSPMDRNPIYQAAAVAASRRLPVPCGILKAAEVELGLSVSKNAEIRFVSRNEG